MRCELKPYAAYKDSGTEWLGRVPAHWEVLPNRTLFSEVNERDRQDEQLLSVTIGKGVILQADLLQGGSKKDSSNEDKSSYKFVMPGDVVYNKMRAWQGAIGASEHRGIVSPAYIVMRPRRELDVRYYHYLLRTQAFATEAESWSYGITSDQWSLRAEHFKMIYNLLPPLDEQHAIARYLDHTDLRIRRYIRAKQKLISLLEEQRQAIVREATTASLRPHIRAKRSELDWLETIPAHWELRRAKDVCIAVVDCKNRTPSVVPDGEFIVVRTSNVRNGKLDLSTPTRTDAENYREWTQRGAPREGDVLFTREAPAGEACLVPENIDICMGQRMMYFRPEPTLLDGRFLLLQIYGPIGRRFVEVMSNGNTVGHLRTGQVGNFPLLWCPVEEQREIVRRVDNLAEPIEDAIERTHHEVLLLKEYRTKLVQDVVTGRVDVRGDSSMTVVDSEQSLGNDDIPLQDDEIADDVEADAEVSDQLQDLALEILP